MLPLARRWWPLAPLLLLALWLRTHDLTRRPIHADEANQAIKAGALLEAGEYAFDPRDHHGPTLYYATLPAAWLRGQTTLAALDETTLRLVPALAGTVLVLLVAWAGARLLPEAGKGPPWAALLAGALVAVTPASVYYSRDYIQETLLLTFTIGALAATLAWWSSGRARWAVAAGLLLGLMQATKGTAPLFLAAAAAAAALLRLPRPAALRPGRHALVAFGTAGLTAGLLYSSFGSHFGGVRDAFGLYLEAARRFGQGAAPTGHEKPWWYYLWLLGWHRAGGLSWHQLGLSVTALAGLLLAWRARARPLLGATLYTGLILAAFSAFAYKTPWQVIHVVPGLALLAAFALSRLSTLPRGTLLAAPTALLLLGSLYQQTARTSFARPSDARNPFAYVQASPDVRRARPLVEAALQRHPEAVVRVIGGEYWPLPWTLRGLPRVGYWATPPASCEGALIIAAPDAVEAVRARLHGNYRESFLGLRPGVLCAVFTREP